MAISDIPVRSNGERIVASWFNTIRTELLNLIGTGSVSETQFTIADNQSTYQDITGLSFAVATYSSFKVQYTIFRTDGSSDVRRETGTLTGILDSDAGTWSYSRRRDAGDDSLNVAESLFVTTAGQVQYKSDSMGGTYSGKMRYKVLEVFLKET